MAFIKVAVAVAFAANRTKGAELQAFPAERDVTEVPFTNPSDSERRFIHS